MIALMRDLVTGDLVGLHRTFPLSDGSGKAPTLGRGDGVILRNRAILGTWGAICIPPANETRGALGIAEGIENALTASQIMQWEWGPVWAAGNQHQLATFPTLAWVRSLAVFADHDTNGVGVEAANTCEARWLAARRNIDLHIPPAGFDWNDFAARRAK